MIPRKCHYSTLWCTENVSKAFCPRLFDPKNIHPRKFDPKHLCPRLFDPRQVWPKKRKLVLREICPKGNLTQWNLFQKVPVQQKFNPKTNRPKVEVFVSKEIWPRNLTKIWGFYPLFGQKKAWIAIWYRHHAPKDDRNHTEHIPSLIDFLSMAL